MKINFSPFFLSYSLVVFQKVCHFSSDFFKFLVFSKSFYYNNKNFPKIMPKVPAKSSKKPAKPTKAGNVRPATHQNFEETY